MPEEKEFIRFKTIIEVLGKPKEHVEKALNEYLEKIKETEDFAVVKEDVAPAKEQGNMFSAFVEMEVVVKIVPVLIGFCFDYMPSSIEVLKPEELKIKNTDISNFLNDLQAKLHGIDMIAKKLKNENDFLRRNLNVSLQNVISIILSVKKSASKEELMKLTGISEKEIDGFLDLLIKEEKIKKEDNLYTLK